MIRKGLAPGSDFVRRQFRGLIMKVKAATYLTKTVPMLVLLLDLDGGYSR